MDPELNKLKIEHNALRHKLIAEYHQLTKAQKADPAHYARYRRLQNPVMAKRKRFYTDAKDKIYDNFFEHVGNHIIGTGHVCPRVYPKASGRTRIAVVRVSLESR